ncbi:MAG: Fic family protein [Bacteroidota bacterium]
MKKPMYAINPDRTKPWNDLPLLPINKSLYETIEILKALGEAKAALARLQGRSAIIPDQGLLINTISLQEAKISSEIENIFTTDDELYKAYSENHDDSSLASKEVLRYREALWSGFNYLREKGGFDMQYFIKTFQEIKQTNDQIRPPFIDTTIKKRGSTSSQGGEIVYTPPRDTNIIKERLNNLISFLNADDDVDPLIKMTIGHFQFEAIHPFRDGNGRTGRVLNIHYLTTKGLLDYPILFLSRYILDHKEDYYYGLQGVSQRGDWANWILFMLKGIKETSDDTYEKINAITNTKDNILLYLKENGDFLRTEDLVNFIFRQPYTKVNHFVSAGIYAEKTARNYLNQLCEMQVLEKKTISGKHYYLNIELQRILSE